MRLSTIGGCRTFLDVRAWRSPDLILVVAGPFSDEPSPGRAATGRKSQARGSPTKRLSKRSLLKQRRAGYRPPAWTRELDDDGRTDRTARRIEQLRRDGGDSGRPRRWAVAQKGPAAGARFADIDQITVGPRSSRETPSFLPRFLVCIIVIRSSRIGRWTFGLAGFPRRGALREFPCQCDFEIVAVVIDAVRDFE